MKQNVALGLVFILVCIFSGTGLASFEDRDSGARPAALAGAYTASSGDIFGVPYNPAGLSQLGGPRFGISMFRIFQLADFSTFFAAYGLPLGKQQALCISEQFFGVAGYYSENTLTCSYGREILRFRGSGSILLGLSLGYLQKSVMTGLIDRTVTGKAGWGLDMGLLAMNRLLPDLTAKAGFAYHKKQIDGIQDSFAMAFSFLIRERFSTAVDYEITQNALKIGEEISIVRKVFFLRGGLVWGGPSSGESDLGLGWNGKGLAFDYALRIFADNLALTHRFSINIDF